MPLTKWFLGIYLITQNKNGISALELSRQLGVSYNAAWRLKHKLMKVMLECDSKKKLSGRVEIDDAYIGAKRVSGKRGRGAGRKTPFVAAVETDCEKKLSASNFPNCTASRRKRSNYGETIILSQKSVLYQTGCPVFRESSSLVSNTNLM